MKNFLYALRYLTKARGSNVTRVISLALGLGVGFLVFSFVNYQLTFNRVFPDRERIYQVWSYGQTPEGQDDYSSYMNAPLAPAMQEEIPQIEAATRLKGTFDYDYYYNDTHYEVKAYAVDTQFFSVLDYGVIAGDPGAIFADKNQMMISRSLADRIFGNKNPVGEILLYKNKIPRTVAGIFEDPPVNTQLGKFDALVSFESIRASYYTGWDGGDSFPTYFKLKEGADIARAEAQMDGLLKKYGLYQFFKELNVQVIMVPIIESAVVGNKIKLLAYMLAALGFLTIFIACMNYILISVSTLVQRSKTIGMLKCNGATRKDIFSVFLYETLLILLVALVIIVFLIYSFQGVIESVLQYPVSELFAWKRIWVPCTVVTVIFLLSGLIPAQLFTSIPVNAAFKGAGDNRKRWKQILLFVQLTGVSFAVTFLIIIILQFNYLTRGDFGYEHDRLVYASLQGNVKTFMRYERELAEMPQVKQAGTTNMLPIGYSGQPAYDENTREMLFSCRTAWASPNYIPAMKMEIAQGKNFTWDSSPREVLVNEKYVRMRGWKDSPVGKQIIDTDDGSTVYTIIGVLKNFRTDVQGSVEPLVMHNVNEFMPAGDRIYGGSRTCIRLTEMTPENISAVQEKIKEFPSSNNHKLVVVDQEFGKWLRPVRNFRNTVIGVSLIAFTVALIGLLGYLADELRRRSKEIAVRKISGARMRDIIRLLARDIAFVLLPAITVGIALGYYVVEQWLRNFEGKIMLRWWIFTGAALLVVLIVFTVEVIRTWRIAGGNPVTLLQNE